MVSWLRGGRSTVVDGDPRRRRRRCGDLTHPALMIDSLSSNSVLEEEATTASLSPGLDRNVSSSAVAGHSKQSGGRQWRAEHSSDTSELKGDSGMVLFFVDVLTEQRVRVVCQAARRVVATGITF
jgi:hypothetical protein